MRYILLSIFALLFSLGSSVFADFVATPECSTGEFTTIFNAVKVLYPTRKLENQTAFSINQCTMNTSSKNSSLCFQDCDTKVSGSENTSCKVLCNSDDNFATTLEFSNISCNTQDFSSNITACLDAHFNLEYCESKIIKFCPSYINAPSCTAIEYHVTRKAFQQLYPHNSIQTTIEQSIKQCQRIQESNDLLQCNSSCKEKLIGAQRDACMDICSFDADFAKNYQYKKSPCESLQACQTDCQANNFSPDYCNQTCANQCILKTLTLDIKHTRLASSGAVMTGIQDTGTQLSTSTLPLKPIQSSHTNSVQKKTSISITDHRRNAQPGIRSYQITIKNLASLNGERVQLIVPLSSGVIFKSASMQGELSGDTIIWNLGTGNSSGTIFKTNISVIIPDASSGSIITLTTSLIANNTLITSAKDSNTYTGKKATTSGHSGDIQIPNIQHTPGANSNTGISPAVGSVATIYSTGVVFSGGTKTQQQPLPIIQDTPISKERFDSDIYLPNKLPDTGSNPLAIRPKISTILEQSFKIFAFLIFMYAIPIITRPFIKLYHYCRTYQARFN